MIIKKRLFLYKKWAWLLCLIIPFSFLYAVPEEEPSDKQKDSCPCAKIVNKIYDIEKKAAQEGASIGKAYRIKDDWLISPEMIARALRCKCAKQKLSSKGADVKKKPSKGITAMLPGGGTQNCRTIMELQYEYASRAEIEQVSNILRSLASEIEGKTLILMKYGEGSGVTSKILLCDIYNSSKGIHKTTYPDLRLKKFDDYVLDPKTGLVWQRCSRGQQVKKGGLCEYNPQKTTFSSNEGYCRFLPSINGMRWRLPQIEELLTIVRQHGFAGNAKIDSAVFSNTPPEVYWSSTPSWSEKAIMTVDFESGRVIAYDRFRMAYTRCVADFVPSR